MQEEKLQLIYFPRLLEQQFIEVVFIATLQSVLYQAFMYLIVVDSFTSIKAAIAVASITVELIFFICALLFLFLIVLQILESSRSRHLSFHVFFFSIIFCQICLTCGSFLLKFSNGEFGFFGCICITPFLTFNSSFLGFFVY